MRPMTDRIRTLTVYLTEDTRTDDAEATVGAIRMLRSVARVDLGAPVGPGDVLAREIAKDELRREMAEMLMPAAFRSKR